MNATLEYYGYWNAYNNLQHWIDNTGTPYRISPAAMLRDLPMFSSRVSRIINKGVLKGGWFDSGWLSGAVYKQLRGPGKGQALRDWYYALNGYRFRVYGIPADVDGRAVESVTVDVFKRYNWGNPTGGPPTSDLSALGGAIYIRQNDMAALNTNNLAWDYNVWGSYSFSYYGGAMVPRS
jgi:hypothetical protein